MTNSQRRDAQMGYIADQDCGKQIMECREKLQRLNFMDRRDYAGIMAIVKELFGSSDGANLNPPFYCDYGCNIHVGKNFFANYNCTMLDCAKITIGDNCQFAPNVSVYTAGHPIHPDTRNSGVEYGKEVTIGDNVWVGGSAVICPGVHIGSNCVIGAGSVVTHDIPDWSVACGNPARVIKTITEEDRRKLCHSEMIDDELWEYIDKR